MLDLHLAPVPDICDVCGHAQEHGLDVANEHALVRLATMLLIVDLQEAGGDPSRLSRLAVRSFPPVEQGPWHALEPRHWFCAIFHESNLQLVLRGEQG